MKFKVGDNVKCVYNDNGTGECVGLTGKITRVRSGVHPYDVSFSAYSFSAEELELQGSVKNKANMTIGEKMKLVFKGEPEKTFIKAGVMNVDETLTTEGSQVFMAWLLKKHGEEFKKAVVDPILAEEESDK